MKSIKVNDAIEILRRKGNRYLSMMNFLQFNRVESLVGDDEVVIGKIWSDDEKSWTLIAADTVDELEQTRAYWMEDQRYAVLEEWMYPVITQDQKLLWDELCYTYYVPEELDFVVEADLPTIPEEYIPLLDKHWTYEGDWTRRFIANCLKRGLSSLKLVEGQPAGWAAMQDDGAMGFMFVLPEYRGHGYAKEITVDLIKKMRAAGRVPFVHIVHTNEASLSLVRSMGFELLKKIYWLEKSKL